MASLSIDDGFVARNSCSLVTWMLKPANTFWGPREMCHRVTIAFLCVLSPSTEGILVRVTLADGKKSNVPKFSVLTPKKFLPVRDFLPHSDSGIQDLWLHSS